MTRVKPVKAWALVKPSGIDTAWIGSKVIQQMRAANALRYLKQKCSVIPVLITPAPPPKRRKK
jgi:hypothetical protein